MSLFARKKPYWATAKPAAQQDRQVAVRKRRHSAGPRDRELSRPESRKVPTLLKFPTRFPRPLASPSKLVVCRLACGANPACAWPSTRNTIRSSCLLICAITVISNSKPTSRFLGTPASVPSFVSGGLWSAFSGPFGTDFYFSSPALGSSPYKAAWFDPPSARSYCSAPRFLIPMPRCSRWNIPSTNWP